MRKKILVVFMCFTLVFAVMAQDIEEVKAFAPAVPVVLAVGAVALGAGIYFYNKDDLEAMTNDCLDWMKENVFDAYSELIELTENGGKILISTAITQGILSYLKHKFGWGQSPVTSVSLPKDMDLEVRGVLDSVMSMPNFKDYVGMSSWLSSTSDCLFTGYADEEADAYYVYAWSKGITDIYRDSAITSYASIKAIVNGTEQPIKNICKIIGIGGIANSPTAYEFSMSDVIPPYDGMIVGGSVTYANARVAVSANSNGFLSGVNVWAYDTDYKLGNKTKKGYLGITGSKMTGIDVGSNAELQDDEKVVTVPTVGSMTIDEFIDATKDLAIDDTPAWIDVIDKIIATDTDVDVPTDVPGEDTKPSEPVPPLVSDFTADLTSVFPFCLPFDLIHLVKALDAEPVAPKWEIPLKFKYGKILSYEHKVVIDMKEYESVVKIFRTLETLGFIVGLVMITRNQMIKG